LVIPVETIYAKKIKKKNTVGDLDAEKEEGRLRGRLILGPAGACETGWSGPSRVCTCCTMRKRNPTFFSTVELIRASM
jgi:hypothetical protein